jgi:tannase
MRRNNMPGGGGPGNAAVNGTISAQAAAFAQAILDGQHTTDGRSAYFSYQPSAAFEDAKTAYNSATNAHELSIAGTGGGFVKKFIQMVDENNISSFDNVTYDNFVEYMGPIRGHSSNHLTGPSDYLQQWR